MKTAFALFLAAAAFCTASSLGALPLRSSTAAPAAIVLTATRRAAARPKPASERPARVVVRRRVEQTRLSTYQERRVDEAHR
jgi:hypothetical protein